MAESDTPERKHERKQTWFLFFVFGVMAVVLQLQIVSQGHRLDDIEAQSAETIELTADAKAEIHRIGAIADKFAQGNPDQAAAFEKMLLQIDAIYRATVPEDQREGSG